MKYELTVVDAFTSEPFSGNPAAVCILPSYPDDTVMEAIALEMNLSETAFPVQIGPKEYKLRWFSPACEVELCGHATLATAHALREAGKATTGDTLTFNTLAGMLMATLNEHTIVLDFPLLMGEPYAITPALKNCLGVEIMHAEQNESNLLVEVADMAALRDCRPDFVAIAALPFQGLIVTTAKDCGKYDFASRYFGPNVGVQEDPVCGSAHCFLAPYWAVRLHKLAFRAYQASRRGGELGVSISGSRVMIEGAAVTTLSGTIHTKETGEVYALDHAA